MLYYSNVFYLTYKISVRLLDCKALELSDLFSGRLTSRLCVFYTRLYCFCIIHMEPGNLENREIVFYHTSARTIPGVGILLYHPILLHRTPPPQNWVFLFFFFFSFNFFSKTFLPKYLSEFYVFCH